ncbi:MAG: conjugal transfer protein TraF [Pseudomonadota bacterium]
MPIRPLCLLAAAAAAGSAAAAPYAPFDVRAAGMGGTGVASSKAAGAALFNPAMLSMQHADDDFQFVLGIGGTVADEDEIQDQFDELDVSMEALNNAIDGIDTAVVQLNAAFNQSLYDTGVTTAVLSNQLKSLDDDTANVLPGAGLGFGVPGPKLGVGVFIGGNGQLSITTSIDNSDTSRLDRYAAILSDGVVSSAEVTANSDLFVDTTGSSNEVDFVTNVDGAFDARSSARAIGVAVAEAGIALSHRFDLAGGGILSAGITPKAVEILTYDYTANTDDFEDSDIELTERTDSAFDVDLGAVYKTGAESPWQFGFVAKNLVGGEYETAGGRTIDLGMQLRAGAAHVTERTTLAFDLDLTENDGTTSSDATQFLAFGAEYDLTYLQLRAGYRANLAGSDVADVASIGFGLGPVDISAAASDGTLGAYLQLGFGW